MAVVSAVFMAASPAEASAETSRLLSSINATRAAAGVGPLSQNGGIDAVALNWARHMASTGILAHNGNLKAQMPGGWGAVGENVAFGPGPIESVHRQFVNSPSHYSNMISGRYTQVGLAVVSVAGLLWVVEAFWGPRSGGSVAPRPAVTPRPQPAPAPRVAPAISAPRRSAPTAPKPPVTTSPAQPATTTPTTAPAPPPAPPSTEAPSVAEAAGREASVPSPSITAPSKLAGSPQSPQTPAVLGLVAILIASGIGLLTARRVRQRQA